MVGTVSSPSPHFGACGWKAEDWVAAALCPGPPCARHKEWCRECRMVGRSEVQARDEARATWGEGGRYSRKARRVAAARDKDDKPGSK